MTYISEKNTLTQYKSKCETILNQSSNAKILSIKSEAAFLTTTKKKTKIKFEFGMYIQKQK